MHSFQEVDIHFEAWALCLCVVRKADLKVTVKRTTKFRAVICCTTAEACKVSSCWLLPHSGRDGMCSGYFVLTSLGLLCYWEDVATNDVRQLLMRSRHPSFRASPMLEACVVDRSMCLLKSTYTTSVWVEDVSAAPCLPGNQQVRHTEPVLFEPMPLVTKPNHLA